MSKLSILEVSIFIFISISYIAYKSFIIYYNKIFTKKYYKNKAFLFSILYLVIYNILLCHIALDLSILFKRDIDIYISIYILQLIFQAITFYFSIYAYHNADCSMIIKDEIENMVKGTIPITDVLKFCVAMLALVTVVTIFRVLEFYFYFHGFRTCLF